MAANELLRLIIEADTKGAVKGLEQLGSAADRSLSKTDTGLQKSAKHMQRFGAAAVGAGALGVVALYKMGQSASNLEQAVGSTESVFGSAIGIVDKYAKNSVDAYGMSERAFRESMAPMGAMLQNLGMTNTEAAAAGESLVQMGADLSAVFGGTSQDAVNAMGAALRGEYDSLEKYGIKLSETAVTQKAVEMGLATSTTEVDKNAKATATLALIQEQGASSAGAFAKESDTAAVQQQKMAAALEDASADIGAAVLPVMAQGAGAVAGLANAFTELPGPAKDALGAIAVGGTGILLVGGTLATITGKLIEMKGALGSLKDMGSPISKLTAALGNNGGLAAATGVASIAVVLATAYYADYAKQKQRVKEVTEATAQAHIDEATGIDGATDAALANELANDRLGKKLLDNGIAVKDWIGIIEGAPDELKELQKWTEELGGGFVSLDTVLEESGLAGTKYEEVIRSIYDTLGHEDFQKYIGELNAQGQAYETNAKDAELKVKADGEVAGSTAEATAAQEEQNEALEEAAQAWRDSQAAMDDYRNAQNESLNVSIAYEEALDEQTKTIKENSGSFDINTEKGRANLKVTQDGANAVLDLADAHVKQTGDISGASKIVETHTKRLNDEWRAAGLTEDQIAALNWSYGLTPDQVHTWLTADPSNANAKVAEVQRNYDNAKRYIEMRPIQITSTGGLNMSLTAAGYRAEGGPVRSGSGYVVGEEGPEYFVPDSDGTIVPNHTTVNGSGGGTKSSGGDSIVIYVTNPDPEAVVRALEEYKRRNGTRVFA